MGTVLELPFYNLVTVQILLTFPLLRPWSCASSCTSLKMQQSVQQQQQLWGRWCQWYLKESLLRINKAWVLSSLTYALNNLITLNFYLPLIFKLNYWLCDTLKNPGLFFLRNDWVLITCSTCGCEKCHPGILVNEFVHIYMWDTCCKKLYHTINPKS